MGPQVRGGGRPKLNQLFVAGERQQGREERGKVLGRVAEGATKINGCWEWKLAEKKKVKEKDPGA